MSKNKIPDITPEILKERLSEKRVELGENELSAVVETIRDIRHEYSEDGPFTLVSFRWKTKNGRYTKISIPW